MNVAFEFEDAHGAGRSLTGTVRIAAPPGSTGAEFAELVLAALSRESVLERVDARDRRALQRAAAEWYSWNRPAVEIGSLGAPPLRYTFQFAAPRPPPAIPPQGTQPPPPANRPPAGRRRR